MGLNFWLSSYMVWSLSYVKKFWKFFFTILFSYETNILILCIYLFNLLIMPTWNFIASSQKDWISGFSCDMAFMGWEFFIILGLL